MSTNTEVDITNIADITDIDDISHFTWLFDTEILNHDLNTLIWPTLIFWQGS